MQKPHFKSLMFLALLMTTVMQISIIIAYKPVTLGNLLVVPGGVIGFPLVFTIGDIITEVFGYQYARKIVWQSVGCSTIFTVVTLGIISLPSPASWHYQMDYEIVFSHLFRVLLAVIFGVTTSSFINLYLFARWKIFFRGRFFSFRCFASSAIGEIAITIIAGLTAFYGAMPNDSLIYMLISCYVLSIIYSFIVAFPANLVAIFLKRFEQLDHYDYSTNFNPFKL
ncbi:MAG: queuosine precursor transporter [Pseudomonadota bacterium]